MHNISRPIFPQSQIGSLCDERLSAPTGIQNVKTTKDPTCRFIRACSYPSHRYEATNQGKHGIEIGHLTIDFLFGRFSQRTEDNMFAHKFQHGRVDYEPRTLRCIGAHDTNNSETQSNWSLWNTSPRK